MTPIAGAAQSILPRPLRSAVPLCTVSAVAQEAALAPRSSTGAYSKRAVLDEAECTWQNLSVVAVLRLVLVRNSLVWMF